MSAIFKAGLVQLNAGPELEPNLEEADRLIRAARAAGADVILTPENTSFIAASRADTMVKARPERGHPALARFTALAKETGAWLLIGSLSIKLDSELCANRSYLIDPTGAIAASYDKIHMFDVDLKAGESYRESASFRPGDRAVIADLPWARLGLTVCYDLRFAYLYRALAQAGASVITVPAAFTRPTGAAHWHILLRARAIETGSFILAPAQCGVHDGGRGTFGHSLIIGPWGDILAEASADHPEFVIAEIDPAKSAEARAMIPALRHDRPFAAPESARLRQAGE
jgi:deaminated glutathione amidase